jgi:dCMP deaminase
LKDWKPSKKELDLVVQIAMSSPDPYRKVGCLAIDERGLIITSGYNHAGGIPTIHNFWKDREARRPFMIHAEQDLIADYSGRFQYKPYFVLITLFPCEPCMNLLAAAGVRKIFYMAMYAKDAGAVLVAQHHGIELEKVEYERQFEFIPVFP